MEHFNGILFHKSKPANKQHTNHSINVNYMILALGAVSYRFNSTWHDEKVQRTRNWVSKYSRRPSRFTKRGRAFLSAETLGMNINTIFFWRKQAITKRNKVQFSSIITCNFPIRSLLLSQISFKINTNRLYFIKNINLVFKYINNKYFLPEYRLETTSEIGYRLKKQTFVWSALNFNSNYY